MLARIVSKRANLFMRNRFSFGGGHGNQDYSVHIDKNSPWIKYKSVRNQLLRIQNLHASKVSKMLITLFSLHSLIIHLNILKISHFSHGTDLFSMNHGSMKIHINLISQLQKEDTLMDQILLKQDKFTLKQYMSQCLDLFSYLHSAQLQTLI